MVMILDQCAVHVVVPQLDCFRDGVGDFRMLKQVGQTTDMNQTICIIICWR